MNSRKVDVNRIQVNRPCTSDWESMVGDERMRFCAECEKQVYNLSSMTRQEIETLVHNTGGKFCAKVMRNLDDSVITASANVGFNFVKLRASKIATAVMTATLSLSQPLLAQTSSRINPSQSIYQKSEIGKDIAVNRNGNLLPTLKGTVSDQAGASIAEALITLSNENKTQLFKTNSNEQGSFIFSDLPEGVFELKIESRGFVTLNIKVNLEPYSILNIDSVLAVDSLGGCEVNCGQDEFIEPTPIPNILLNPIKTIKSLLKKTDR